MVRQHACQAASRRCKVTSLSSPFAMRRGIEGDGSIVRIRRMVRRIASPRRFAATPFRWKGVKALLEIEERAKLFAARRMPQLAQSLGLYLPDALAGDVELLADFFQRVVGVHVDAEAHAQHLG